MKKLGLTTLDKDYRRDFFMPRLNNSLFPDGGKVKRWLFRDNNGPNHWSESLLLSSIHKLKEKAANMADWASFECI